MIQSRKMLVRDVSVLFHKKCGMIVDRQQNDLENSDPNENPDVEETKEVSVLSLMQSPFSIKPRPSGYHLDVKDVDPTGKNSKIKKAAKKLEIPDVFKIPSEKPTKPDVK